MVLGSATRLCSQTLFLWTVHQSILFSFKKLLYIDALLLRNCNICIFIMQFCSLLSALGQPRSYFTHFLGILIFFYFYKTTLASCGEDYHTITDYSKDRKRNLSETKTTSSSCCGQRKVIWYFVGPRENVLNLYQAACLALALSLSLFFILLSHLRTLQVMRRELISDHTWVVGLSLSFALYPQDEITLSYLTAAVIDSGV